MEKRSFTAEQIRQEVLRRLIQGAPVPGEHSEMSVPLPIGHSPDAEERNWDMKHEDHAQHNDYVRRVINEARRDFLLSDSAERDEILGDSFAHS
ncbi:hypothetical protein SBC1_77660 (plasmid) [Caballeronia sp. SBC1]|uniref:hypothetical protein n=1 Tax=unclassified Caballeronia TaxID=2646786 RepID=UPI0013E158B9|nr:MULTISPECIES: hypothetical protein [unclassified Caballeronia]QIE30012.1 hypothetical protein SBC2_80880 [Caballeronia sp. SBC2]QIN67719.1 hypothetical protein SBC1_77660 [Caballeronia sp. SBC1]